MPGDSKLLLAHAHWGPVRTDAGRCIEGCGLVAGFDGHASRRFEQGHDEDFVCHGLVPVWSAGEEVAAGVVGALHRGISGAAVCVLLGRSVPVY